MCVFKELFTDSVSLCDTSSLLREMYRDKPNRLHRRQPTKEAGSSRTGPNSRSPPKPSENQKSKILNVLHMLDGLLSTTKIIDLSVAI